MSAVETATGYVRRMVERECRGWGDQAPAMHRLEVRYGIGFNTLAHLFSRKAKTVDGTLLQRIRSAYLDLCERQVAKLQHEIEVERVLGTDDTLEDLESEAAALAARIAQKKAARR